MLTKENFTEQHIKNLQKKSKRDPALLERTIYAFGLLEAITRVGLPFVFKGGTCLILLLEHPKRLSTDIDIVVSPGTEIDEYIMKASTIFPFKSYEEQVRTAKKNIEKRHFKFIYTSPITGKDIYVFLDVLFSDNPYEKLTECGIKNDLLLDQDDIVMVNTPSINCLLGDKLTAFAPHTTGIPLNIGKDMEIMKQMYDISSLIDVFTSFDDVYQTYFNVAKEEITYRGNSFTIRDALLDTIRTSICIASKGKTLGDEYPLYVKGIHKLQTHIFAEYYSAENAIVSATKIMYMATCILTKTNYTNIHGVGAVPAKEKLKHPLLKCLGFLRKINLEAYGYALKTDRLLPADI